MPPTKATRSSMTIVFSWWQCSGRSRASSAQRIRVPRIRSSRIVLTAPREGVKTGSGAPAQASTRTSTRSASLRQQVAQDHRLGAPRERELRREEPAGDVDVGPGALDLGRDPRKGLRAVDENLDLVPRPRWGTAGGPAAGVGVEGSQPADPRESAPVMGDPGPGHRRAEEAVRAERDTGG